MSGLVGGIDLGATTLAAAVAHRDGPVRGRVDRETPTGSEHRVKQALKEALEAAATAAGVTPQDLAAVGVGSVGPLDQDAGIVNEPPNLAGVQRLALRPFLEELTGRPVVVHNDAIAGLLAERAAGAPPNSVYLTLSTGIGAGAAVDGHVLSGRRGNAAEVGHFVVDPDSELVCGCGSSGHWEAYAAGAALPKHARHLARTRNIETGLTLESLSTPALVDAAETDPLADKTLAAAAEANAIGLAGIVHAFDPAQITIGGTLGHQAAEWLVDPAIEAVPTYLVTDEPPAIRLTTLEDPVLTGALEAARSVAAESE